MKKRYKVSIVFGLIILLFIFGYYLRVDRFGFTKISWVDFIEYKNELYTTVTSSNGTYLTVNTSEIGEIIGEVKFTLEGNVSNSRYKIRNFDASFLKKGTQIYRVKGKDIKSLAVYKDGSYYLYQVK